MTLHPQAEAFLRRVSAAGPSPLELSPEEARTAHKASSPDVAGPAEDVADVADLRVPSPDGEVGVRLYTPAAPHGALIVYLHGGGWVVGTLDTYDALCRALANRAHAMVASVDYRVSPEHRFPAPLTDARAATSWAAEQATSLGVDPARVVVAGDSAGGHLAALVALRARDAGAPPLAAQVLVYPALDPTMASPSHEQFAEGYYLTRTGTRRSWDHLLGPEADRSSPEVSPLRVADLSGLPRALVLTAEYDPLRDEGEAYVAVLQRAGTPATLIRMAGQIHGFFRFRAVMDDAEVALEHIADFVRALP